MLVYGLDYDELGRNLPDLYQLEDGRINHWLHSPFCNQQFQKTNNQNAWL